MQFSSTLKPSWSCNQATVQPRKVGKTYKELLPVCVQVHWAPDVLDLGWVVQRLGPADHRDGRCRPTLPPRPLHGLPGVSLPVSGLVAALKRWMMPVSGIAGASVFVGFQGVDLVERLRQLPWPSSVSLRSP